MNKPTFRAWDKRHKVMRKVAVLEFNRITEEVSGIAYWVGHATLEHVHANDIILMQSTGLKDNSEEPLEIWQKSIVKIVNNEGDYFIGVVEYFGDQGYPAFDIDCKYYKDWHFESNVLSEALGNDNLKIYVIGDEYSNPELLNEVSG